MSIRIFFWGICVSLLCGVVGAAPEDSDEPIGSYFGQTPPISTPVLFAPDIIDPAVSLHGVAIFGPEGKYATWTLMTRGVDVSLESSLLDDGTWSEPTAIDLGLKTGVGDPMLSPDGQITQVVKWIDAGFIEDLRPQS